MTDAIALHVDPMSIDKNANWKRIDLGALWKDEFWPILRDDAQLRAVHEGCVNDWLKNGRADRRHTRRWKYTETCEAPFFFTSTDGAVQWVDARIDEARAANDPSAWAHDAIMTLLCGEHELALPKSAENALWREANKIEAVFHPQRETHVEWWRPGHSCHWFAPFGLCLATAWRPDLKWQILEGELHSTVVCLEENLIFDLLLWDDETTDLIEFATRPAPAEKAA